MQTVDHVKGAASGPGPSSDEWYLHRWVLRLRTGLLGPIALSLAVPHRRFVNPLAISLVLVAACLYYAVALGRSTRPVRRHDPLVGLGFTTLLVHWSGGLSSAYFGLYYIDVVLAAVTQSTRGALLIATGAGGGALLAELAQRTWWATASDVDDALGTLPYLFLVGLVCGRLMELWQSETLRRQAEQAARANAEDRDRQHEEDLAFAADVQQALLPRSLPQIEGCDLASRFMPEHSVGGDFYHVDVTSSSDLELAIADVRGKGLAAALLLAGLRRSISYAHHLPIPRLLERLNRDLCPDTPEEMFITFLYCRVNLGSGQVAYGSAGHVPLLLSRGGARDVVEGETTGLPLGLIPTATYEERHLELKPGDRLVLMTDGVAERRPQSPRTQSGGGRPRGPKRLILDRLEAAMLGAPDLTADATCEHLLRAAGLPEDQDDDATLLVLKWGAGRVPGP
ncbi:MAG TPA: PP2C family protein-serine/threonine phosphatase [Armatimonadota bacterium]|jgi:serine phosphatase RsbU (regulator of sigma subunit)